MNIFNAIIPGLLLGATEFLPIASSGHLALARQFLDTEEAGLSLDVALHRGTLLAVLISFFNDFFPMGKFHVFFRDRSAEAARPEAGRPWRRLPSPRPARCCSSTQVFMALRLGG